ncbi:hypothetical protein D3C84_723640 [compost metagenome]
MVQIARSAPGDRLNLPLNLMLIDLPMPYDSASCQNCPYFQQAHLPPDKCTDRTDQPVELECHGSKILIVAEAPGVEEWRVGAPLQSITKRGGTAGARMAQSWKRTTKRREDFDIVNTVQCYPGVSGARDARPHQLAVCSCSGRLAAILREKNYDRVICFGTAATEVVTHLQKIHNFSFEVCSKRHPTGGITNAELDSAW